jgi:AbrB family looped-hinge helix DNA binding protein
MTRIAIRKSGGANIISLPKAVLKTLGLHEGSTIDLSLEDNKIILTPVLEETTLEELLAGSPKKKLNLTEEDREWLSEKPIGKEL